MGAFIEIVRIFGMPFKNMAGIILNILFYLITYLKRMRVKWKYY